MVHLHTCGADAVGQTREADVLHDIGLERLHGDI